MLDFVARWTASGASESANKDLFLLDLCDALDVERPKPVSGDLSKDDYVFEADAIAVHEGGRTTIRKIDRFKRGCFILEAKQGSADAPPARGRRGAGVHCSGTKSSGPMTSCCRSAAAPFENASPAAWDAPSRIAEGWHRSCH